MLNEGNLTIALPYLSFHSNLYSLLNFKHLSPSYQTPGFSFKTTLEWDGFAGTLVLDFSSLICSLFQWLFAIHLSNFRLLHWKQ